MNSSYKIVISASRRTDIPAFYMPWFMDRIDKGFFEVTNPYNQRVTMVPATPDNVHTIVFWSKNFNYFLENRCGDQLIDKGFHLFFNFTLNSSQTILEPNVPFLEDRIHQLEQLCDRYHPQIIHWRFDPVCFFKCTNEKNPDMRNNLDDFEWIAEHAHRYGIQKCITSFMDHYPKIGKRTAKMKHFEFIDPPMVTKIETLLWMKKILDKYQITLQTCCEKDLLVHLPPGTGISGSSCIPNDLLMQIFGGHISLKKDSGQRIKQGCGCMTSTDIGSYHQHPCYHNCLFCYANPSEREK